jgi:hypothetical protein
VAAMSQQRQRHRYRFGMPGKSIENASCQAISKYKRARNRFGGRSSSEVRAVRLKTDYAERYDLKRVNYSRLQFRLTTVVVHFSVALRNSNMAIRTSAATCEMGGKK